MPTLAAAFPDHSPVPGTCVLYDPGCRQDACLQASALFQGKPWRTLPPAALRNTEGPLLRLSDQAFAYYLPAYLQSFLDDYHGADVMVDCVIGLLTPPGPSGVRASWRQRRAAHFNAAQTQAIAAVLQQLVDQYHDAPAQAALDRYWRDAGSP